MSEPLDIIVPTLDNYDQVVSMISSVLKYDSYYPVRIIVVNNGNKELFDDPFFDNEKIVKVHVGENIGWEGALRKGLEQSTSEFVMFANDDIYIPEPSKDWLVKMIETFSDETVGAVGPATNVAMGQQNIFSQRSDFSEKGWYQVAYLIGFCLLLRRSALDKAGGVDDTLPGGDDIDLSIRLIDSGYKIVLNASTFVYHHGFSTGSRVHGDHTKKNGWNSLEMQERTNTALVKKHGLRRWHECLTSQKF